MKSESVHVKLVEKWIWKEEKSSTSCEGENLWLLSDASKASSSSDAWWDRVRIHSNECTDD